MWLTAGPILTIVLEYLLRIFIVGIILLRGRGRPASKLAWIVIVLALPVAGAIAYLLIGEVRLGRSRIRRHKDLLARVFTPSFIHRPEAMMGISEISRDYRPVARLAEAVSDQVVRRGNALEVISATDMFIQRVIEDIDAAEHHCHLLVYIYLTDRSGQRVAKALMRAAKRGVACRVLVDDVGSRSFLRSSLRYEMESAGVRVVGALPASVLRMAFERVDLRNHRKIIVIDGVIGYTGSHNIADAAFAPKKRYAPWIDVMVRMEGPASRDLQLLFVEDWYLDTDELLDDVLNILPPIADHGVPVQIVGTGPAAYIEAMHQLVQTAVHLAREEIILTTPYFVPDDGTFIALCTTARRGVDVSLVVPHRNDSRLVAAASRSFYEPLLEAGVSIYEYRKGLLHAKTLTVDRDLALVSTANLDRRSFELNFEVSMVVYDSDFASQLRFVQRSYMDDSIVIRLRDWHKRSTARRLAENAAGMLSPLL